MGQSGTRQAGVHTSSGPPSGEREDPEGKLYLKVTGCLVYVSLSVSVAIDLVNH